MDALQSDNLANDHADNLANDHAIDQVDDQAAPGAGDPEPRKVHEPEVMEPQAASTIPASILRLAKLTPEHLPLDGDDLLLHIEAAAAQMKPTDVLEWLDCCDTGRDNHAIADLYAKAEQLRRLKRRHAMREILKPGWLNAQGRPPALPDGRNTDADLLKECRNSAGPFSLEIDRFDMDEQIEAVAKERLKQAGLPAHALDAEAFRMGLTDQANIAAMIAAHEIRRDKRLENFQRRRDLKVTHH